MNRQLEDPNTDPEDPNTDPEDPLVNPSPEGLHSIRKLLDDTLTKRLIEASSSPVTLPVEDLVNPSPEPPIFITCLRIDLALVHRPTHEIPSHNSFRFFFSSRNVLTHHLVLYVAINRRSSLSS